MAIPFCRPVKAPPPVYISEALLLVLPALMTNTMVIATNAPKIARLSQVLPTCVDSSAAAVKLMLVLRSFLAGDQHESVHDSLGKPRSCQTLLLHLFANAGRCRVENSTRVPDVQAGDQKG